MVDSLLNGYLRSRRQQTLEQRDFLKRLSADGQSPDALFIGCSDSRVIPEHLTATSPGSLFVVRNVANLVPPLANADASVSAAIEYAVDYLSVPHIIVCGHYGCGGVYAAIKGLDQLASHSELRSWLKGVVLTNSDLQPSPSRPDENVAWRHSVEANVMGQLQNLSTFPQVKEKLAIGKLQLHGWAFDMGTHHLRVYDGIQRSFVDAAAIVDEAPP